MASGGVPRSNTMTEQHGLLDELEDVLARQDIGRRRDIGILAWS